MKKDETRTDPPKRKRREAGGEEVPNRRTAAEEVDRLTNMAVAIGAGASLVPIPGTSAALSAMELLLIGAITKIYDHPLSDGFVAGLMRHFIARWGAAVGLHIAADAVGWIPGIGTLVKPAVNAGCIKFLGASMRDYMAKEHGKDAPAAVTAEEAKEALERAMARVAAYAPDLKDGAKEAFQGDGKRLAKTLRKMFGPDEE
jgi:hypothetical protein